MAYFPPNDIIGSGNITTQNLIATGTGTAGSYVAISPNGQAAVSIQVSGTYTGALTPQVTVDGTNWISLPSQLLNTNTGAFSGTIVSASVGIWECKISAVNIFRVVALGAVTGTATVTVRASYGTDKVSVDNVSAIPVSLAGNTPVNLTQVGGSAISKGQSTMSNSLPVTIASDQTPLPISSSDSFSTGTLININDAITLTNLNGASSILVQVSGSWVNGNGIIPQWSADGGTTWTGYYPGTTGFDGGIYLTAPLNAFAAVSYIQSGQTGMYAFPAYGAGQFRLTITSAMSSGSAAVNLRASSANIGSTFLANNVGAMLSSQSLSVALGLEQVQDTLITAPSMSGINYNLLTGTLNTTAATDTFAINTGGASFRSLYCQVTGSAGISAGKIIFEGSNDNANFVPLTVYDDAIVTGVPITTATAIAANTNRFFSFSITYRYIRCRISTAFTGGTVIAISRFCLAPYIPRITTVAQATYSNLNVNLPQFTASAAASDATANPTSTGERCFDQLFNGSTWDRFRNNANGTTGDTGAKTATFSGAAQTNYDAKGAQIFVLCGTVSGTSPTLSAQLQISPDSGTTWINYGAASGNVTATGDTILFTIYPTNISQAAGSSIANLTTGATQSVLLNAPLPRVWRLNYTIGGTSPSFTITGVYVNYQK